MKHCNLCLAFVSSSSSSLSWLPVMTLESSISIVPSSASSMKLSSSSSSSLSFVCTNQVRLQQQQQQHPHQHQQLFSLQRHHHLRPNHNIINNNNNNQLTMRHYATNNSDQDTTTTNNNNAAISSSTTPTTTTAYTELEIEKKFPIPNTHTLHQIEQTLASLNFHTKEESTLWFVDWYFDLAPPHWHFSLQDVWIRYRETKVEIGRHDDWGWRGVWQVKRGKKKEANGENGVIKNEEGGAGGGGGGRESDGMTSYDEFQGEAAKDLIYEMLSKLENKTGGNTNDDASATTTMMTYDGFNIPLLAGAERLLVPFARFETRRTSWQFNTDDASLPSSSSSSMMYSGLKIDLDKTDFNYMVGEVEAVFTKEEGEDAVAVEAEKEKIRNLVDLLTAATATTAVERNGNNDDIGENSKGCMATTIGKLEFYMINNRRDHYDACVRAGVMMN